MQHSKSYKITSKQKPISVRATLDTVVCGVTPYHLPNCTPSIGSTTPPVTSTPALAAARIFNFSFNAASLGHVATGTDCRTRFLLLGAKINGPPGKSAATKEVRPKKAYERSPAIFGAPAIPGPSRVGHHRRNCRVQDLFSRSLLRPVSIGF